ncbi:hypothetical protein [Campylobacter insulaenigrae]|uniref:hypothetical protein n=1 Tax=Campylobacter insulaenigrae TaxID=260714 RepID=UPI002152C179|nr:hypothetical protein [Campylobacter insulaenigrae]MCR6574309.1 hypothetical protein [Campylobacter insulaenigrae]
MYISASIDVSDLEFVSVDDVLELFNTLENQDQELFLKRINEDKNHKKRIKDLFQMLSKYEALELLNELNDEFKSDEEWREIVKKINNTDYEKNCNKEDFKN